MILLLEKLIKVRKHSINLGKERLSEAPNDVLYDTSNIKCIGTDEIFDKVKVE